MIRNRCGEQYGGGTPKTDSISKNGIRFYFRRDNKRLIGNVEVKNNKIPVAIHYDNNHRGVIANEEKDAYGNITGIDVRANFVMPSKFNAHTELIVSAISQRFVALGLAQRLDEEQIREITDYILSDI